MYCSNCGNQVPDTSKFCNVCGASVVPHSGASATNGAKRQKTPNKKKFVPLLAILVLLFVAAAALSVSFNMSIPEIVTALGNGEPLRERGLYDLAHALEAREERVSIRRENWDTDICPWEQVEAFLWDYLQADPALYYVDIRNTAISKGNSKDVQAYSIKFAYFEELTADDAQKKLEQMADRIVPGIPAGSTDWETALYLHDELIRHVTYQEGSYDQTAYGALVEGKAVCMGYAMAYEYLLTKAGVACDTVIGYSDEFSAAMDGSILQMPQHAWTVVTFHDGGVERSYFVDTTWDDPDLMDMYGNDYINHRWFCVTHEDILREGRSKLQEIYDLNKWNLDDHSMNYHVSTGAMVDSYDLQTVIEIFQKQLDAGSNLLSVRMADLETYYALSFAVNESGDYQRICDALGITSTAFSYSYDYLGDGILCFDIYVDYPG